MKKSSSKAACITKARGQSRIWGVFFVWLCLSLTGQAQPDTGWKQTAAGSYSYTDTDNWVDGVVNGIWDDSLSIAGSQTILFGEDTTLLTGLSFKNPNTASVTFRGNGGDYTLTLGGNIEMLKTANGTNTFGSTTSGQHLDVDLGGVERTFSVMGSGRGSNGGNTLRFLNNVSNGGVVVYGASTGGGVVEFGGSSNGLSALTMRTGEVYFNGDYYNANAATTISGALTASEGNGTITVRGDSTAHYLLSAGSYVQNEGTSTIFRGNNLGVYSAASATADSSNILFSSAPTLTGGGGAAGTSTISILAGALGSNSYTGTGLGATGGLVTYDSTYGVRLLGASEFSASITDGQTQLDNVKYANSSGTQITTNLTAATTTINSLSFDVTGATGNQGVIISGDAGTTLKINSGVIYGYQSVTTAGSPTSTDAMTITVPTLDLNGQDAHIFALTKLNTGGTVTSNAPLTISSAITNANSLTLSGPFGTSTGYVVFNGATANTYTGTTYLNESVILRTAKTISNSTIVGDLVINGGVLYNGNNQIADTSDVTVLDGTFYLNGSNNSGSATSETINNFTMSGGSVSSGSGTSNNFIINGDLDFSGGAITMPTGGDIYVNGDAYLTGGRLTIGASSTTGVVNAAAHMANTLNISNTEDGAYTPVTLNVSSTAGRAGGSLILEGDLVFTGNGTNSNTVTIAAATGTGDQGTVQLEGVRTFNIGDGAAKVDLTVEAGVVDGSSTGSLVKTGGGTLSLLGTSTYTGATTVSAGTLLVNGSLSGTSSVTVSAGATLGGSGTINAATTIAGQHSPGNSPAVQTFGSDLNYTTGASVLAEYTDNTSVQGSPTAIFDQIVVGGNLDFAGATTLSLAFDISGSVVDWSDSFWSSSQSWLLYDVAGTTSNIGNLSLATEDWADAQGDLFNTVISGYSFSVSQVGSDVFLNYSAVPEPSTYLLLGSGLLALWGLRRKKSKVS